jgi:hypothetical protein
MYECPNDGCGKTFTQKGSLTRHTKIPHDKLDKSKNWIEKAKKVHGDLYDYSKVVYTKSHEPIIIICVSHDEFIQRASDHLNKCGCPKCGKENAAEKRMKTLEQFIEDAKIKHGDTYNYDSVIYSGSHEKVAIRCSFHGIFMQAPYHHINGNGCPMCADNIQSVLKTKNNDQFIIDAIAVHGIRYDYSKVVYCGTDIEVEIICKLHGSFMQKPNVHIQKRGCKQCGREITIASRLKKRQQFIDDAIAVHGTKYDYSKVAYAGSNKKVEIICKLHGSFMQKPSNHLSKRGCKSCTSMYSKNSIEWLDFVASCSDIHIQHMLNGGEYVVGKYKIDGYCKATNTCYEFHGTMWHAHPNYHNPNDYNRVTKKSNAEIYRLTLERECYIRNQGYNLVVMWEHDWNDICKYFLS